MLTIRNVRRVGALIEFIVDHPDGSVLTLPAWATDHTPCLPPPRCRGTLVLLHPAQLVTLSARVANLLKSWPSSSDKALDRVAPEPEATAPEEVRTTGQGEGDDAARHPTRTAANRSDERTPTTDSSHGATRRTHAVAQLQDDPQRTGGHA
jgi:hypothetical protein